MKKLTGTLIAVLVITGLVTGAVAQHQHGRQAGKANLSEQYRHFDRHENRLDRMADLLELTDEQKTTIEVLYEQGRDQTVDVRKEIARLQNQVEGAMLEDVPSERDLVALTEQIGDLRTQLKVIRLKTRLAVRAELTDEQRDRWLLSEQMHERRGGRKARAPRFPRGLHERGCDNQL